MRTFRFALLGSAAAVFAACGDGVVAPTPGAPASVSPFFSTGTTVEEDSVISGYGCPATGGIEYEYSTCPDTTTAPQPTSPSTL